MNSSARRRPAACTAQWNVPERQRSRQPRLRPPQQQPAAKRDGRDQRQPDREHQLLRQGAAIDYHGVLREVDQQPRCEQRAGQQRGGHGQRAERRVAAGQQHEHTGRDLAGAGADHQDAGAHRRGYGQPREQVGEQRQRPVLQEQQPEHATRPTKRRRQPQRRNGEAGGKDHHAEQHRHRAGAAPAGRRHGEPER